MKTGDAMEKITMAWLQINPFYLPDQFHQTGRMALDHTSGWQRSTQGQPEISDHQIAGSSPASQHCGPRMKLGFQHQ
jgi:hypothetical protein